MRFVLAVVAVTACTEQPHTMYGRFVKTGGTCPSEAAGVFGDFSRFAIQPSLATSLWNVEIVPTASSAGSPLYMRATDATSAAATQLAGECSYDGECGCMKGILLDIDSTIELRGDRVSLSLLDIRVNVGPNGVGCTSDAVLAHASQYTACTLEGEFVSDAPYVTHVDAAAAACTYTLHGVHFASNAIVGALGGCSSFSVGDAPSAYCPLPIDSKSSSAITVHFDTCPSGSAYLVVVNPDPGSPATGTLSGQYAYVTVQL